jgi:hypothetical protein
LRLASLELNVWLTKDSVPKFDFTMYYHGLKVPFSNFQMYFIFKATEYDSKCLETFVNGERNSKYASHVLSLNNILNENKVK